MSETISRQLLAPSVDPASWPRHTRRPMTCKYVNATVPSRVRLCRGASACPEEPASRGVSRRWMLSPSPLALPGPCPAERAWCLRPCGHRKSVTDAALKSAQGFLARFAFGDLAVVVGASGAVSVSDLGD
jgi:hypothetical protein